MTVLLFVATILTFLGIDYLVRRSRGEVRSSAVQRHSVPALQFPEGIFFSKTHTWLNLFPSGTVRLGVDDFVKRMFVSPQVTLLKAEGATVTKGEAIIRMREGGNTFCVYSPIDGRITERNMRGSSHDAPFHNGWAYAIEPAGGAAVVRNFLLGTETASWMKSELARLRDFMASATAAKTEYASVWLQDGGEPMPGVLNAVSAEQCAAFEQEFLSHD